MPDNRFDEIRSKERFGPNIRIYEENEIFSDPPDIIIVGREDCETPALKLLRELSSQKPVVFCAYSGNFQSKFDWSLYRGAICTDLPSRIIARYHDIPAITYLETFDFDRFPFTEYIDTGVFPIRSYIQNWRSGTARKYFEDCRSALQSAFGSRVLVQNISGKSWTEVRELMRSSALTMHIRDSEGFGWSVIESLSTGRPLLSQAGLSRNMLFNEWVEPGVSGFQFERPDQVVELVRSFIDDPTWLRETQRRTAEVARAKFRGDETASDLVQFLEDLHRLECVRWFPNRPDAGFRRAIEDYSPSLDPMHLQDFERLFQEHGA